MEWIRASDLPGPVTQTTTVGSRRGTRARTHTTAPETNTIHTEALPTVTSKVGGTIRKHFHGYGTFEGKVTEFDKETGLHHVEYQDGDGEDLDWEELKDVLVQTMTPWKDVRDGNRWDTKCELCRETEIDPDDDPLLHCHFCHVVQHEGCAVVSQQIACSRVLEGSWMCPKC